MALNNNIQEQFRTAFERKCFILIVDAYKASLSEKIIQLDWNENDISQELCEKIENNPNKLRYKITVSREHHLTKKVAKEKGFADKLPRIDFKMSNFRFRAEYKYFFEAKRLKENDSGLKRAYINDGMDRFISNKYPLGCMLGYLLQGNVNRTMKGINSLLVKDKRSIETLTFKKNNLHKDYFESKHIEIGVLKHLIFDFTNMSN